MNDDQLLREVGRWLKDADPEPPDAHERVREAMARTPRVRQRGRWWPLPSLGRPNDPPVSDQTTIAHQPSLIPATNGHTPTVLGRTQTMFTPVKAITAGAVIFALGGTFLIAGPFGQPAGTVPGAVTDSGVIAPVEFTAHVSQVTDCFSRDSEEIIDGVEHIYGTRCRTIVEDSSDPRFSGTWFVVNSEDGYGMGPEVRAGSEYGYTVWTNEYRVENGDGAWQSDPVSGIEFAEREMMVAPVFTGEGAYEGLTAIVEMSDRETDVDGASDASLRGAIFVGSPPPPSGFPTTE